MNPQFSASNMPPGGVPGPHVSYNQDRKPYNGFELYSDGYGAPPMSSGKAMPHPSYMGGAQNGPSPRPPMEAPPSSAMPPYSQSNSPHMPQQQSVPPPPPGAADTQFMQRFSEMNISQGMNVVPPLYPGMPGGGQPSRSASGIPPMAGDNFRQQQQLPPPPQQQSNKGRMPFVQQPQQPPPQQHHTSMPPSQFRQPMGAQHPPGAFGSGDPPTMPPSSISYQNDLGPQYNQFSSPNQMQSGQQLQSHSLGPPGDMRGQQQRQSDMSQNGPYYSSSTPGDQTLSGVPPPYGDQSNGHMSPGMTQYPSQMSSRYPPPMMSQPGMQQSQYPPPGGIGNGQKRMPGPVPPPDTQTQRRLDPDSMPSPIQVIEEDKKNHTEVFSTSVRGQVPPLVTTDYVASDGGICIPRFMRSTIYNVPTTAEILKQTCVPFALALTPFAKLHEGENPLPLSNLGETGPVRCNRCKAYMCPFMQFIDGGRRFQCMFCKATTEVPPEYFAHLDHMGDRVDKFQRPELCLGSYEFVATKEYCKNSVFPSSPAFIFVIDVSYNSVRSGMLRLLCDNMNAVLSNIPREPEDSQPKIKVGFITYSNVVHFFNIKGDLAQPQMMVVSDVQDMFVPLLDGFLVDYHESQMVIDSLLLQLPDMFADTRETETVLGPAIQAGLEAIKAAECSGKLFVFHTTLPLFEAPGKLKNRDDRKLLGTDKEKTVLCPQTTFYNNLGQECVAAGCCVDLFLFPNAYIDVATLGQVCRLTGGEMFKYTFFQADIDGARFLEDLKRDVSKPIAFDAIIRVRTSTGIRPTEFWGNFFMSNTTDIEVAAIDCDKTIAVEIKYDDKLVEEEGAFIQAAVLYTSCGGQRRLRVHNLALQTGSQMGDMFRTCELDTIMNVFSKEAVRMITEQTPQQVKNHFISRSAQILACYRKHCANRSSIGQLILPECMKLLPLYINCLVKSDAISGGQEMSIDDRSFIMLMVNSMNIEASASYLYPRLLPMYDIDTETDELPVAIRCSIEKIKEDSVYLIENGLVMFLWVGMSVNPEWLQDVFALNSAAIIDVDKTMLMELNTPRSKRVRAIIQQIQEERQRHMRLFIVRQGDKLELLFRQLLVEDRTTEGSSSYVDFLCHLHKEIRLLLT